jgi:uncharacterized protein YyaL (SSP411 family)
MIPNRLIKEKSPYLLQHAHNPVDWYPWGEEAFLKAQDEDKPIFLSVGYSTCYWCHVMEREVFENETIARLMNELLVCIKVDREERPDIDRIYMNALQVMTDQGGWPMSVFLTSDLKPFFGGTYIPPTPRYGRPGFPEIVRVIDNLWKNDRQKILDSSSRIVNYLKLNALPIKKGDLSESVLDNAYQYFTGNFDPTHGGFGGAPKFPRPVTFNFLLRYFKRTGTKEALQMTLSTLRKMADGGVYDQIGGGFHRYSVDTQWRVPHFEKMLYDQAQLAVSYLEAFQITKDSVYADIAQETLDYVGQKLTHSEGGFYTAEDAESVNDASKPQEKEEGAFYTWTKEEVIKILGQKDGEIFCFHFGLEELGNALHDPMNVFYGKNILYHAHSLEETANTFSLPQTKITSVIDSAKRKLFGEREKRFHPYLDDKIITAWNGLMISAFSKGYTVSGHERYLQSAINSARFILSHLFNTSTGKLYRRYRDGEACYSGGLQDYAFLIQGLLDLYEASFDVTYIEHANMLTHKQIELFRDSARGGFYDTTDEDASIIVRSKEFYDSAEPTGNSVSALNLLRLSFLTNKPELRDIGVKTIEALGVPLTENPEAMIQMLVAYQWSLCAPQEIIIAGNRDSADTEEFINEVHSRFLPHKVIILTDENETKKRLTAYLPMISNLIPVGGKPTAYICENFSCQLPITDINTLRQTLDNSQREHR